MVEQTSEYYKNLLIKHSPNAPIIFKCLDFVKNYIIKEKLIVVGGMSIDFALRLKGKKLYNDDDVPDYDFISSCHWKHAYKISQILANNGIEVKDISVINAMHPTTMRVRVLFESVADSTYIPQIIYENIPHLTYKGIRFVHPHYQYIDQHRSLSMGFEELDMGRPVILNRWKKDMVRYDMLYEQYPIKWEGKKKDIQIEGEKVIPVELLKFQCITGFVALLYWKNWAEKKGFKTAHNLGKFELAKAGFIYNLPTDSHGISIYTNNIEQLYKKIKDKYRPKDERYYKRFIDKLPRKIILDNTWEILDNKNNWIAAHKIDGDIYIANLQTIMLYLLINYILLNKIKNEDRGYTFCVGYYLARELLEFGAKNNIAELLPTAEYYGAEIHSESFLLAKDKLFRRQDDKIIVPEQPRPVYEKDLRTGAIASYFYEFNPDNSELFDFDGGQCKKFI